MSNFKASIPEILQQKIKQVAGEIDFSEIIDGPQKSGFESEQRIDEIVGNYKSAWMPNQDGGYSVSQWCRNDDDPTYHFTKNQTDYNNRQSEQCYNSFLSDYCIDVNTSYGSLSEEQQEDFHNYEAEWFCSALLQFDVFVEDARTYESEDKQVVARLSIYYKDAPYYREKYAEDIKIEIFEVEEFMTMPVDQIIGKFKI